MAVLIVVQPEVVIPLPVNAAGPPMLQMNTSPGLLGVQVLVAGLALLPVAAAGMAALSRVPMPDHSCKVA